MVADRGLNVAAIRGFVVYLPLLVQLRVRAGRRLVALGVSSLQRDSLVPEVPTIAEAGVLGYDSILWFGLLAPARTSRPVIAKLNREIVRILDEPEAKARWAPIGLDPRPTAPEAFDRLIAADIATFTRLASTANIKAE